MLRNYVDEVFLNPDPLQPCSSKIQKKQKKVSRVKADWQVLWRPKPRAEKADGERDKRRSAERKRRQTASVNETT